MCSSITRSSTPTSFTDSCSLIAIVAVDNSNRVFSFRPQTRQHKRRKISRWWATQPQCPSPQHIIIWLRLYIRSASSSPEYFSKFPPILTIVVIPISNINWITTEYQLNSVDFTWDNYSGKIQIYSSVPNRLFGRVSHLSHWACSSVSRELSRLGASFFCTSTYYSMTLCLFEIEREVYEQ
jgi:hypothetical protein